MKHKYQTQFCACREFRFQHFVELALDENFKKSKYRQRAQQLPFSLLIFSALWEGEGGSESGNPRGHFGPRLNVTAKPTKLKPKLFLNSFWFSSKSCSTGIFINGVRSFFDTENKKCCSFQEFFTVTNIISIRWNRSSIPCVYLWRWMPEWQEIVASWKKLNWGMPSLYIGRKWLTLKYPWCWADQRRSLRQHIFMSGLSSNGSIAWNIWEVVEIRWGSNEGHMM